MQAVTAPEDTTLDIGRRTLSEEAVARVVAIEDPALRNLWITQTYAELGHRLLDLLETDQTWCTFAIWASNTAGLSIRDEELPRIVGDLFVPADEPCMHPHCREEQIADAVLRAASDHHRLVRKLVRPLQACHLARLVQEALGQVSAHIAHGNTLVYRELAPLFVRLLDHVDAHGRPAPDDVEPVLHSIGVPVDDPLVWTAFTAYATALGETDGERRAQLVLTANVAAVLHEQQRLQDDVAAALDAGLLDVGGDLEALCHRAVPGPLRRWIVRAARRRVAGHLEHLWEHVATRRLMTLTTPTGVLHLGVDVPAPAGAPLFPAALERLDQPRLVELMDEWDTTGGTGRGSGARDWAILHDRMGYIVNLFRSRQRILGLTTPPFTPAQLDEMSAGRVPADL